MAVIQSLRFFTDPFPLVFHWLLRFLVRIQVFVQLLPSAEFLVTLFAPVWSFTSVCPFVQLALTALCKAHITVVAFVGLFSCMCSFMSLSTAAVNKGFVVLLTRERFLSSVCTLVKIQASLLFISHGTAVILEKLSNHMSCKIVFIYRRFSVCNERTLFAKKDVALVMVLSGVSKPWTSSFKGFWAMVALVAELHAREAKHHG